LGVQTDAETASDALSQNSQQAQALIDALKEAGVADSDIQTQQIQLQPRYQTPSPSTSASATQASAAQQGGQPELVGYTATNTVQVRTTDLENLGALLDAAVSAGGNRIDSIAFQVSDPGELLDQARETAWADAMHKAEQLAGLAGQELGPVATISESSQTPYPVVRQSAQIEAAAAVPVEPGTQTVQANVNVTWQLQPAQENQASATLTPTGGPPGTTVELHAEGLPANTQVTVAAGVAGSESSFTESVITDEQGALDAMWDVPKTAQAGETWAVQVTNSDTGASMVSVEFQVTAAS
jgi:hypothetical protein